MHLLSIADTSNETYKITSIHFHGKKLYLHLFDKVNTDFSYEREKEVASIFSAMHLLRFYFVRQTYSAQQLLQKLPLGNIKRFVCLYKQPITQVRGLLLVKSRNG